MNKMENKIKTKKMENKIKTKKMKKEKVLQTVSDYNELKEEIIKTSKKLNELDSKTYSSIDDIVYFEVEKNKVEDYLYVSSEEYHVGCGDYERDSTEFPFRYLWEDFDEEVLKTKKDREQAEKEKAKKEAEAKIIAKEEKDKKQLKNLLEKIKNEQLTLDDDFTIALNELLKNKIKKQKDNENNH